MVRFLLFALLLGLPAQVFAQALAVKQQTITTGNNAYDAGTYLGIQGVTQIDLYNAGTNTNYIAFDTDNDAGEGQLQLLAGERWGASFAPGKGPKFIYTKGNGAAGTLRAWVANSAIVSTEGRFADVVPTNGLLTRTCTIGFADLTAAAATETEVCSGGTFPTGARQVGFELTITTAFTGGTISAATVDCGTDGASLGDTLTDGTDVFTGATSPTHGLGTNGKPWLARDIGGKTPQCTVETTGDDTTNAAAGAISYKVFYYLPTAG